MKVSIQYEQNTQLTIIVHKPRMIQGRQLKRVALLERAGRGSMNEENMNA